MTPSFTSAGSELRQLARVWRTGNQAFRELFDVLPKQPDETYNRIVLKPDASTTYREALQGVNDAWVTSQVSKATRVRAQAIRQQRQQLTERGVSSREATKQLKPLRRGLQESRERLAQELSQKSGIVSQIREAKSSSDAAKAKALLVLSLGQYIEENT